MTLTAPRVLLVNPPHTAIGSRVPREQLPPLGLLAVGGPLLDAGFAVELLDAELGPLQPAEIVRRVAAAAPDIVMLGHSGSSSVHATVLELTADIRRQLPAATIVYGGVHPTYHWAEILAEAPQIDLIVRGEGEETTLKLAQAIAAGTPLDAVPGLAFRDGAGMVVTSGQAPLLTDLDAWRVGWELIDHADYSYWGGRRAVVVQFSRGCPHLCSYCGQRGFWTRWRHRDPQRFAAELARLYREHGVTLINFADELRARPDPARRAAGKSSPVPTGTCVRQHAQTHAARAGGGTAGPASEARSGQRIAKAPHVPCDTARRHNRAWSASQGRCPRSAPGAATGAAPPRIQVPRYASADFASLLISIRDPAVRSEGRYELLS